MFYFNSSPDIAYTFSEYNFEVCTEERHRISKALTNFIDKKDVVLVYESLGGSFQDPFCGYWASFIEKKGLAADVFYLCREPGQNQSVSSLYPSLKQCPSFETLSSDFFTKIIVLDELFSPHTILSTLFTTFKLQVQNQCPILVVPKVNRFFPYVDQSQIPIAAWNSSPEYFTTFYCNFFKEIFQTTELSGSITLTQYKGPFEIFSIPEGEAIGL